MVIKILLTVATRAKNKIFKDGVTKAVVLDGMEEYTVVFREHGIAGLRSEPLEVTRREYYEVDE
jgi:hypothetical protein